MQLFMTQEVKAEIDRNLSLRAELVAFIHQAKTENGSIGDDFDEICEELQTGKYSFDDLTYGVKDLVSDRLITEGEGTLILQALCAMNEENEGYFLDDSHDLKAQMKAVFHELKSLTDEERKAYFDTIQNDKYQSYLYRRAVAMFGVHNALADV